MKRGNMRKFNTLGAPPGPERIYLSKGGASTGGNPRPPAGSPSREGAPAGRGLGGGGPVGVRGRSLRKVFGKMRTFWCFFRQSEHKNERPVRQNLQKYLSYVTNWTFEFGTAYLAFYLSKNRF